MTQLLEKLLGQFRIKTRLLLLVGTSFMFIVILVLFAGLMNNRLVGLEGNKVLIEKVLITVLELRRNEKDFLARKDLTYQESFSNNYEKLQTELRDLEAAIQQLSLEKTDLQMLIEALGSYQASFHEIVTLQEKIGLNEKVGLYGNLRKSVHAVEEVALKLSDKALAVDLLMMRRREKDFMLRNDLTYLEKFETDLQKAYAKVTINEELVDDQKDQLTRLFDDYATNFREFVKGREMMGLTADKGLLGQLRSTVHQTDTYKEKLRKDYSNAVSQSQLVSNGIAILISLGFGVILFVVTLPLIKAITDPLKQVVDSISRLRKGETDVSFEMGSPVHCSSLSECGVEDCPSYDKTTHCWVESGSDSNYPSCPKAQRGEDCHECEIYKKTNPNEITEMGAALQALCDELKLKANIANSIANGDLTKAVPIASDKDTLGIALQQMTDSLKQMIDGIKWQSNQVSQASEQLSDSNKDLSSKATDQASSLEEIMSALQGINQRAQQNRADTQQTLKIIEKTEESAKDGSQQMRTMLASMEDIHKASQKIDKIMKVIDEIAFQTNLLALNAAVEAARAGKYGKGFAVVADEVRSLAVRSAEASKETSELIGNAVSSISNGSSIVKGMSGVLETLNDDVTAASELVKNVSMASQQQESSVSEVNQNLDKVGQTVQQYAATTEETSAISETLQQQAVDMNEAVRKFQTRLNEPQESTDLLLNTDNQEGESSIELF